jgi:hypothetical protein
VVQFMDKIDQSKLREAIPDFLKALHASRYEAQQKVLSSSLQVENSPEENINLNGKSLADFPSLKQYGIPMVKSCIQSVLRDIYSLNQVAVGSDLLTFPLFNEATCSLLSIPSSTDYNRFKRNARRTKWIDRLLQMNAVEVDRVEEVMSWILRYLGENYEEQYTSVAVKLGVLLAPKVMDAETACAIWEEANCPVQAQRVILRHLKLFLDGELQFRNKKYESLKRELCLLLVVQL